LGSYDDCGFLKKGIELITHRAVLYLITKMLLSLFKKAVHNNQIDEKTFSVANSVIPKVAKLQSNVAKNLPSRWNQKSPKEKYFCHHTI